MRTTNYRCRHLRGPSRECRPIAGADLRGTLPARSRRATRLHRFRRGGRSICGWGGLWGAGRRAAAVGPCACAVVDGARSPGHARCRTDRIDEGGTRNELSSWDDYPVHQACREIAIRDQPTATSDRYYFSILHPSRW